MFSLRKPHSEAKRTFPSELFDEKTFYPSFIRDLLSCKEEVIIESPYITSNRMRTFYPIFEKLLAKKIKIYVVTRTIEDHEESLRRQVEIEISKFERMGVQALLCIGNHHRKIAVLDRVILWEGSLNILSQSNSREIMRRIEGKETATQMINYLEYEKFF